MLLAKVGRAQKEDAQNPHESQINLDTPFTKHMNILLRHLFSNQSTSGLNLEIMLGQVEILKLMLKEHILSFFVSA